MKWFLFSLTVWAVVAGGVFPVQRPQDKNVRIISFALSMLSPWEACAQEVKVGSYDVRGTNPNGSRYHGTAVIRKLGDEYEITWTINREIFNGNGPLSGNVLTIKWRKADGKDGGVVVYKVMKDGSLAGTWRDGKATEVLVPMASPGDARAQEVKAGAYDVRGTNPDGSRYHGTAVIRKLGDEYEITWTINREIFYGNGPLSGNVLTIKWRKADGKEGGVVIYKVMKDGSLVGTWADGKATDVLVPR